MTVQDRYSNGFLTKCAEHGVDGSKLLEKKALNWKIPAMLAGGLGLGYLGSRAFNTDVVGGKMPDLPASMAASGNTNNMDRNQRYFDNNTDYTRRRLIVNDLKGAGSGALKGALLGVPAAVALALFSRGKGARLASMMMRHAGNGKHMARLAGYGGKMMRGAALKGLGYGLGGGALIGGATADANARLRMWEGKDPSLDTVAIGQR